MADELNRKLYKHALRWQRAREQERSGMKVKDCGYPPIICPHCGSYNIEITSLSGRKCSQCGSTNLLFNIEKIIKEGELSYG